MFKKPWRLFSIPTNPKEVFSWIITRVAMSLGLGGVLGLMAVFMASIMLFGFLIGDYKDTGNGAVNATSTEGVALDAATIAENKALLSHYTEVADSWQQGLSQSQIQQVEQQNVDLPGAVLLAIGKMENDFAQTNAHQYYQYLQPEYTWQTFNDITITYKKVQAPGPNHTVITTYQAKKLDTPVTMLIKANTWDGTLTNSYQWVTTGRLGGPGVYTRTIKLSSSQRTYDWSRVWNLFSHIPAVSDGKQFTVTNTQLNTQTLAGLIASVAYTVIDPQVQQMVSTVLFPGGTANFTDRPVQPPSGNVIHDILRWKNYIDSAAQQYQIPAVLIAGVMYQESNGREHWSDGSLKISSAGAIGLMQVMPATAAGMYLNGKYVGSDGLVDLANPVLNIEIGAMYLSELYHQFNNNPAETESAYNAGPGAESYALAHGDQVAQNSQTLNYVSAIERSWIPALTKYFGTATGSTAVSWNQTK